MMNDGSADSCAMRNFGMSIACEICDSYIRVTALFARRARNRAQRTTRGYRVGQPRRQCLKSTTPAAAMAGIAAQSPTGRFATDALVSPADSPYAARFAGEPNIKELATIALDAAKSAGADYADVRFVRNRTQNVSTREQRVSGVADNETYGFGVRTLVTGAWGFSASRELTRDEVARVAKQAVAQARANRSALVRPVVLAPAPAVVNGTWNSPVEIDPFQ